MSSISSSTPSATVSPTAIASIDARGEERPTERTLAQWCTENRSVLTALGLSCLAHLCLLLILAAMLLQLESDNAGAGAIDSRFAEPDEAQEPLAIVAPRTEELSNVEAAGEAAPSSATTPVFSVVQTSAEIPTPPPVPRVLRSTTTGEAATGKSQPTGTGAASRPDRLKDQFAGRTDEERSRLVKAHGGTEESEAAVWAGLEWLAVHQRDDGGWSYDHTSYNCRSSCDGPGALRDCEIGATAMALLCFLGAGQTHQSGKYQETVDDGINFLLEESKQIPQRAMLDLRDGSMHNAPMYVQGMATTALSEAYALTYDSKLHDPAQEAVNFIVWAQDPQRGGWRYAPRNGGDTSVVGWQTMALVSGHVADLYVPPETVEKALGFLRSVASPRGVGYGYTNVGAKPSTTAIGLLCRMYLQPQPKRKSFTRGARLLSNYGPSHHNMYYNYYATQFLHHYGGPQWEEWNEKMRDWLVATQETSGHATGSWRPAAKYGTAGGRLYMTTMAIMTLEVYYRHLPLYQRGAQLTQN